jgi:hypothetical protein
MNDFNDLRKEFEDMMEERCIDNSCVTDEEEDTYDYPDYVEAMNNELMAPVKSGVYISRWDLKTVGDAIDASIAMDARERMFKMLMRSVHNKATMEKMLDAFTELIDDQAGRYEEIAEQFPASASIMNVKVQKAQKIKSYFKEILATYFPEGTTY